MIRRNKKNTRIRRATKSPTLSRRTLLRGSLAGLGLGLALPPLEAMLNSKGAFALGEGNEPFFLLFFWGGGLPWNDKHGTPQMGHPDLWTPTSTGAGFTPTEMLAPITPYNVNVLTGLRPVTQIPPTPGGQADGHMRGFMVSMTGDRPRSEGFDHPSHTLTARRPSLDQLVAKHESYYSSVPVYRSLQVGVSEARFHNYGHWNAISYNGPDSLNEAIMQPTQLYDQLFSMDEPPTDNDSIDRARALDAVLADARSLKRNLGVSDQQRVDAHLEHVSEIQRRLTATSAASCEKPARPSNSGSLLQRTRTMAELTALAIQCGQTKVASFMLTSPASTHLFSNVGAQNEMHKTVHDGEWDTIRAITEHQMECFGALLEVFSTMDTPTGKLIDDGLIYGTSEYGEGYQHNVLEIPVVMAGGACGNLVGGQHLRQQGGNISRAQLTALQALGLPYESFGFNGGETSSPFTEIQA